MAASAGAAGSRSQVSATMRWPIRAGSTPAPTATILPQTSAPWMRGKTIGVPPQLGASPAGPAASPVAPVTALEYQPVRVFTSVLLSPQARTRTSTSPGSGSGRGQSVRHA